VDSHLRRLERHAASGDLADRDRFQFARLRAGRVDHRNLHLWAREYVSAYGHRRTVGAMLAIMRLLSSISGASLTPSLACERVEANLQGWLRSPGEGHPRDARELGAQRDPEWAGAPGKAILEPERVSDLFLLAVFSARAELAVHAIERAGIEMSSQPNGALLRTPRFDFPAVDAIREAAETSADDFE
jgi:hypothetical protein